jgi:hypothetical protein
MAFFDSTPATESEADERVDLAANAAARVASLRQRVGLTQDLIGLGHTFPCDRNALHIRLECFTPTARKRASQIFESRRERMTLMSQVGVLGGVEAYAPHTSDADEQSAAPLWRRRALLHVDDVAEADAILIAGDDPVDVAVRIDILEALYARDHADDRKHRLMVITTTPVVVLETVKNVLATVTIDDFVAWIEDGERAKTLEA